MLGRQDIERQDSERANGEINTVIGRGSVIEGTFTVQNSVRIDGKVHGPVEVGGLLILGSGGEIDGEVRVRDAIIGGTIKNKILASGRVTLEPKSIVQGDVNTSRLVIEEGATFEGKCVVGHNR
ncbi:polymer-forming cytoskeletal protein [candidate division KSB1 bacterium]|nr:polymer-forming cytoskeletal protein [candidate division KSB1 bacterium]